MGYTFCILSRVLLSFFIISHLSIILQLFIVLFYILFEGQNSCGQEVISLDTILRLRELMNSRGWSEYRLAKESKLSMSTISNIFHRGSIPSIPTLETLCNTFGISLGQFFSKGVSFKWSKQKFVCGKIMVKRKMVDLIGIEPTTLRMRTVRSPSWAIGPYLVILYNLKHFALFYMPVFKRNTFLWQAVDGTILPFTAGGSL